MRWQKVARVVVALAGLACAAAVYIYMRPRPLAAPDIKPTVIDPTTIAVDKQASVKLLGADGKPIYDLSCDVKTVKTDNRMLCEGHVRLTFKRNGVPYTVTADKAEMSGVAGPTGEEKEVVVFTGKVRMKGDDGFSVETEDATYFNVEQRLAFPGAVSFTRGRMSGSGVGGELLMDRAVLWLHDKSEMKIVPEGGGPPVTASGTRIGLAETDRYLRVEQNARLTRDNQELRADVAMVYFAEGAQTVHRIELTGRSQVTQLGGGDRPDMRADDIGLDFTPESSNLSHAKLQGNSVMTTRDSSGVTRVTGSIIDAYVGADGKTLTKLDVGAPSEVNLPRSGNTPARTIKSAGLIAEGAEPKGLDRAVFSGGVDYREITPAGRGQVARLRAATSDSLVLGLEGGMNKVKAAEFRQNFKVTDDTMTAGGDEGQYDAQNETLLLRANVPMRVRPYVVDQEIDVKAQSIDVNLKTDAFVAKGNVESIRKPAPAAAGAKPAGAKPGIGLFEDGKPIGGNADQLTYTRATGIAEYTGTVRLVQAAGAGKDSNVLQADKVEFDDKKRDLTATGKVRSTFQLEESGSKGTSGPGTTQLDSDRMTYKEADRTAVYSGSAVMDSRKGERLTADVIKITMLAERRALKDVVADGPAQGLLRVTLPESQVTGLHLTYDEESEQYVVTGKPATFISRSKTKPGICEVVTGTTLMFKRNEGASQVTNEGGAVGKAEDRKCAEVMK